MLRDQFPGKIPAFDIYLHKCIPSGAGLGGGSADASFMLKLVNDYCSLQIGQPALAAMALKLGSDCPFFICNTPQFATGRGEQMKDIQLDLSAYSIQLICPKVHVSTRDAFSLMSPSPAPFNLENLGALPIAEWKEHVSNDFETPVFQLHPVLSTIKRQLYEQGAIYASMSGSGSTLYGIFEKGRKAIISNPGVSFKDVYVE